MDNEDADVQKILVNGCEGYSYQKEETSALMWSDGVSLFQIIGNCNLGILENMVKEDVAFIFATGKVYYDEFIETGLLGCENCYNVFSNKIDSLLKNIHGSNRHVGRISKFIENSNNLGDFKPVEKKIKTNKTERASKIEELKEKLNKAIKEERYEDAAKIRDEIKKEEGR
mgnify:CR=1 FL=1